MRQSNNVKAALYCRVANSFDNPYAIREQERRVYAYAKESGYTVIAVYSDNGYSGLSMERPALQGLIQAMGRGEITHILVKDKSRLFRNFCLQTQFERLCERHGVALITPGSRKAGARQ